MKLLTLGLAIILSLVLLGSVGPVVQADSDNTTVDLEVEVVEPEEEEAPAVEPAYVETDLFGTKKRYLISEEGEIPKIEATSADGNLTMTIPKGTIALDKDGNPLSKLTVSVDPSPPDPPEGANIIGLAYDFGPDGATFDPPITLTWSYDPEALPEGLAWLVLAYYDEETGEWVELPSTVDPVTHTITASVAHFTIFAIIGTVPPVPPPPPVEEEEEEVITVTLAAFSVSNLSIQPAEVSPGEEVRIEVAVSNTGGTQGSYTLVLNINGVKEADRTVTISAGATLNLIFSVTREEAGSYTITVDGLSGSFTVVPEEVGPTPPPTNWVLIIGIIIVVVVVGLLVFFLVIRRRAA